MEIYVAKAWKYAKMFFCLIFNMQIIIENFSNSRFNATGGLESLEQQKTESWI